MKFNNWVEYTDDVLRLEYYLEYEIRRWRYQYCDPFPTFEDFKEAVKKAPRIIVTPELDKIIRNRSRTRTFDELLALIKTYRGYPKFRNEKTLQAIYDGFKNNKPMKMPIVLELPDGTLRVMSGNTRMDVAFQLGINPKVILVKVPDRCH
ncbi:hypothetical protein Rm378p033 [Rhodothermus phage RM378]|uniref:hypothetical protein n=1 Tax=Rhodothermus phage RM378 TaxID=148943 RepID=UPI000018F62B|nr:hypothetical protein Rm378p033 [Rhodothermus phage RM378]